MHQKPTCALLVKRIHHQCFRDQRKMFLYHLRIIFIQLFCSVALLIIFQCANRMYNFWNGPLPMNLKQFQEHLETNYNAFGYSALLSFRPALFQPEYLQVELGVGTIELKSMKSYSKYSDPPSQGILLQLFDQVAKFKMMLYVRFPAHESSYSKRRLPYRFKSFSIQTLRCIVKQIGVPREEFSSWVEKAVYVKTIEEIYDKDPVLFNERVIKKCGILLGYLFYPLMEDIYKLDDDMGYQLQKNVRVFNASSHYIPHGSFVFIAALIVFFCLNLRFLSMTLFPFLCLPSKSLDAHIKTELAKLNGISLEDLDSLLLQTSSENNYHGSMYIVNGKYLIMFMMDFDEQSPHILQQFYSKTLFTIIDIGNITEVLPDRIIINEYDITNHIYFPFKTRHNYPARADWLHARLMILSSRYQYLYEQATLLEEEQQRHLQRMKQEADRRHHRQLLIEEETERILNEYRTDPSRIFLGMQTASPSIIAEYRIQGPLTASNDLILEECVICIEDFQEKRDYARWPCPARHMFHFDCILQVFRTRNKCPLCQHAVEAANIPHMNFFSWFIPPRVWNNL